jgi:abortive infection bacteriophage resistance protein
MLKCGGFFFSGTVLLMKYTKPALSFEQQAKLLISRGLNADQTFLASRLNDVNYYRLSAYWHSFRQKKTEILQTDTSFDVVWDRYVFDRQLRLLIMDAIERIEVSVKTRLANIIALQNGPFGHLNPENLPGIPRDQHDFLLDKISREMLHSKEPFIAHYLSKYSSEKQLPIWMAVEIMDFGAMLTLFRATDQYTKRHIATDYGLRAGVLESWLLTLNYVRNLCAHHGRMWNRTLPVAPLIPDQRNTIEFHVPVEIPTNNTFTVLTILLYLLSRVAPQSGWQHRLRALWIDKHPQIPIRIMGFPENWTECPIWKSEKTTHPRAS